jgi:hypothetical protein
MERSAVASAGALASPPWPHPRARQVRTARLVSRPDGARCEFDPHTRRRDHRAIVAAGDVRHGANDGFSNPRVSRDPRQDRLLLSRPAMRSAWALALSVTLCGCRGSIAPTQDQPALPDASTGVASDAGSPEAAAAVGMDAESPDGADGGPCSACMHRSDAYCVLWLAPDAGAWNPESPLTTGGIVSWDCQQGPMNCAPTEAGAPDCSACGLSATVGLGYSPYSNRPWSVACRACSGDSDCPQGAACGYRVGEGCTAPAECLSGAAFGASCNDGAETPACECNGTNVFLGCGQMASPSPIASIGEGCPRDP